MTPDAVAEIMRQVLLAAFWIAAPLLALGFVCGIVISLAQIVTSIQDTGFSTIPRLIAFGIGLLLLMPWMIERMTAYTTALLGDLGRYAR
ncbi:MAG TPA: flagellar biosynthetic protein FliQ [Bryobacteraceae bacterium]|nr:flagellar biosynthetic protein FliQ [Bryobacteraceae bacterium]